MYFIIVRKPKQGRLGFFDLSQGEAAEAAAGTSLALKPKLPVVQVPKPSLVLAGIFSCFRFQLLLNICCFCLQFSGCAKFAADESGEPQVVAAGAGATKEVHYCYVVTKEPTK